MLSVVMLTDVRLNVNMLNVVMLSVMAKIRNCVNAIKNVCVYDEKV